MVGGRIELSSRGLCAVMLRDVEYTLTCLACCNTHVKNTFIGDLRGSHIRNPIQQQSYLYLVYSTRIGSFVWCSNLNLSGSPLLPIRSNQVVQSGNLANTLT